MASRQYKRQIKKTDFKELYLDLLSFKTDKDFKKYGFAQSYPRPKGMLSNILGLKDRRNYFVWLKDVEFNRDTQKNEFIKRIFGELLQMGMVYASKRGKETELTRKFKSSFDKLIK